MATRFTSRQNRIFQNAQNNMSTSRTDAECYLHEGDYVAQGHVPASFARQLETELEAERDKVAKLRDIIKRASITFCNDGTDGEIAAEMLRILGESKYAIN